ncbi:MAG: GTP-binding protein [Limnochordia bacterium]|jgi:translation elongation factor EF-Tu-like GTPase
MKIGMIGHNASGKSVTCAVLAALFGDRHTIIDTPAEQVEEWLRPGSGVDGLILVVNVMDGPMPYTRKHLTLAAEAGIQPSTVWLNKLDVYHHGPELLEIIEMETRDLMASYKLEDEEVPCVAGSSLKAFEEIQARRPGPWTAKIKELWEKALAYQSAGK